MLASASPSPASTVVVGAFTAAMLTRAFAARARSVSASDRSTETIRPRPSARCMRRARWTTTRTASGSVKAPATYAAAISPTL